ncbi:MAG: methylmalonyl-CoA mutase family protein [Armatimonadota bacterium]|nr:methylmalonyl-CoA mutase family protein [Armatimonadota bacterium]MDR7451192.1 methylmalonyl-CoA mutase family protein [Armatimonadota bacterium]MDR7467203.1 methylmalonyl-CoA mutase family protein [Armatimonadota bacterium]MDR7494869.1 methylmalonyl-CoA mutase family protein [Armatimonadota bacterium]MDR7500073.1 methylmalonyl-CoA mutase family protein [Armatimonadota bacterium]
MDEAKRSSRIETADGIEIKTVFTPADVPAGESGRPGEFPYTRGIHPTMYRGRLWTMRQYAGYGTAEETNRRFHLLLSEGQTGLSVAFDLPTQMGYDSDHPQAEAEVGKAGVAVDTLADMETLLQGIPLDRVTTSMTINATAAILLAMYIVVAERQGIPPSSLGGTVQNDILKEYIARGTYIFPPGPSLRLVTDVFRYCADHLPRWHPISVSGYHIREAGATAVQEVAFTLADGLTYLRAAVDAGLDVDRIAPRLSFFFAAQMNLLEEVAKFRAARRLWAHLVRDRLGAKDPRSQMLRFHTQTAGVALTAQQPENNVVRVTLQALAAVLGGTQSLHTNAMDEALALPTEASALLALRTQQILAFESGVAETVDPLGGAYAVEYLTAEIERRARELIEQLEEAGGMLRAIESGLVQRLIAEAAYRESQRIERGEQVVVGVNRFTTGETVRPRILRVPEEVVRRQQARLAEIRRRRDGALVERALTRLRGAAAGRENLMPFILDAVRVHATLGEICDVLRAVFGVHRPAVTV